jgi:hypothetical protein
VEVDEKRNACALELRKNMLRALDVREESSTWRERLEQTRELLIPPPPPAAVETVNPRDRLKA